MIVISGYRCSSARTPDNHNLLVAPIPRKGKRYVCRVQIEERRMVGWIGGRENQIREARLSRQLKTWAKTPGL
ncbi:Uncharacterized protein TCM_019388 [Theobroma cacao]|uniref:Uncharacterized protein n=1 Tax=Theobroma cacao TaxID=3641 RepID=A0A061EP72_THECC|nr:Uncharacterized protein TCM_019388 [Theobroma cacao]